MSRDGGSTWRPLPESSGQPYDKTQFIVHSTGSLASAANNARYFANENVQVESHFIVGLGPSDPTLQVMDSSLKADASLTASRRAISVEVVGDGVGGFTDWQVSELVRIGRWAHQVHGIPLRLCPSHDAGGYGWHIMFGAPGPWTNVRGKVCPGSRRIEQLRTVIFPAIFRPTPAQEDDDMALTKGQDDTLQGIALNVSEIENAIVADREAREAFQAEINRRLDELFARLGG